MSWSRVGSSEAATDPQVPNKAGEFLTFCATIRFPQRKLCFMVLVAVVTVVVAVMVVIEGVLYLLPEHSRFHETLSYRKLQPMECVQSHLQLIS